MQRFRAKPMARIRDVRRLSRKSEVHHIFFRYEKWYGMQTHRHPAIGQNVTTIFRLTLGHLRQSTFGRSSKKADIRHLYHHRRIAPKTGH